jgi:hypothetical protein
LEEYFNVHPAWLPQRAKNLGVSLIKTAPARKSALLVPQIFDRHGSTLTKQNEMP